MNASALGLAVTLVYLVAITVYGVWVGRKSGKTADGYFLSGRTLGWFAVGMSILGTNISSVQFMSTTGLAHQIGLASMNNDLIGGVTLVVSAIFFVPVYLRSRISTLPEFLEIRFCTSAKLLFGGMFVLQSVVFMPIAFYSGGLAVLGLMGLDPRFLPIVCLVIGGTAGLYAVVGGLTSLVRTEIVQVMLLVAGGLIVTLAGATKIESWTALFSKMESTHFELLQPRGTAMPWTALPGVAIHSIFFFIAAVSILQRALGASDIRQARKGLLFAAYLKLLAIPLFAIPGIIAAETYPQAVGDTTYALMMRDFVPTALSGFVLAGMIAALMSNGEAGVNAVSSLVALDFFPAITRRKDAQLALKIGKIASAAIILFGVLAAPYVIHIGPVYPFLLLLGGFGIVPAGVCFVGGRFSRRVNAIAATTTLATGYITALLYVCISTVPALKAMRPEWLVDLHFYEVIPLFVLFCCAVLFGVSYVTEAPSAGQLQVLELTSPPREVELTPEPWWSRFETWSVVFILIVLGFYLVF